MNINNVVDKYLTEKKDNDQNKPSWKEVAKVEKTIKSCKNEKQLKVATKMMDNVVNKYKGDWNKVYGDSEFRKKVEGLTKTLKDKEKELGIS